MPLPGPLGPQAKAIPAVRRILVTLLVAAAVVLALSGLTLRTAQQLPVLEERVLRRHSRLVPLSHTRVAVAVDRVEGLSVLEALGAVPLVRLATRFLLPPL